MGGGPEGGLGARVSIARDITDEKFSKGRAVLENFIQALPKPKSCAEWILFIEKFLDPDDPKTQELRIHYKTAQKVDLFCKGSPVSPRMQALLPFISRSPDIEAQWYSDHYLTMERLFFQRIRRVMKDEYMLAGMMSADGHVRVPDKLNRKEETDGRRTIQK